MKKKKIKEAIKEGNVEDILRGRQKYRIEPPTFILDVFPTDINQVLFEYFFIIKVISKTFNYY